VGGAEGAGYRLYKGGEGGQHDSTGRLCKEEDEHDGQHLGGFGFTDVKEGTDVNKHTSNNKNKNLRKKRERKRSPVVANER